MYNFGDIFFIDNKEYVWLFSDGETVDAAIILNSEKTDEVKRLEKFAGKKGTSHQQLMYCYVELHTENYIDCSANMIATQKDMKLGFEVIRTTTKKLNNDDLKNIRDEIVAYKDLFKKPLVDFVESIPL